MKGSGQVIFVTKGLPGSGKSTWAKKVVADGANRVRNIVRVNNDDIREELGIGTADNPWTREKEKQVRTVRMGRIVEAMKDGADVIVDNTHLNYNTFNSLMTWLKQQWPEAQVDVVDFTDVPVHTCIDRDKEREKRGERFVGADVILKMAREANITVYPPQKAINWSLPFCIISDLDGTLALFGNRRNPYDASNCHLVDEPNFPVLSLLRTYEMGINIAGFSTPEVDHIFFFSGRTDKYEEQTRLFLGREKCHFDLSQSYFTLAMRKDGDSRADEIVKREMYDVHIDGKYNVAFIIDDRPKVIRMWKQLGLPVFDVGDGIEF